jgi:hypothetical protein
MQKEDLLKVELGWTLPNEPKTHIKFYVNKEKKELARIIRDLIFENVERFKDYKEGKD